MSRSRPRVVAIDAPAKLNLGLEVLGRRDDGYHDLATIFLTIDRCDRLELRESNELSLSCDRCDVAEDENLALRTIAALREAAGDRDGAAIALEKRIPAAAGLGGASSDAAAALLAARDLWQLTLNDTALAPIAATLGSDVPFFLRGGCALGEGRGERLTPLPLPEGIWFVVVAPVIAIPRKTASLYARLRPEDFGDGSSIAAQATRLRAGLPPDPARFVNAFTRPLYELVPSLADLPRVMREVGAPSVALSGAGPAHYALLHDREEAKRVAARLRQLLGSSADVIVAAPFPSRPSAGHGL